MEKKTYKYGTRIALRETVNGSLWCIAAIFAIFDTIPCKIISVILLFLALASQVFSIWGKFEKSDEMAASNLREAKALTLDYLRIIVMIIYILFLLFPKDVLASWNWNQIICPALAFMIGLPEVLTGLLFKRIEED